MDRKINTFLSIFILIGAVAIYFMPVIDVIMLTLLMMMLFIGGIFAFASHTTEAKKKFNPLFRMGVSIVGLFLIFYAVLTYAEFYQGFFYPYGFIPFMIFFFAVCLLAALGITFCSYQLDDKKIQR